MTDQWFVRVAGGDGAANLGPYTRRIDAEVFARLAAKEARERKRMPRITVEFLSEPPDGFFFPCKLCPATFGELGARLRHAQTAHAGAST